MPMISKDGTENELVMVTIKNEIKYIFLLVSPHFWNSNSAVSSTMHGDVHGGGRVFPSLMVVENGTVGFACMTFSFWRYRHGKPRAWTQATALAKRG